jgi:hypothetical protein
MSTRKEVPHPAQKKKHNKSHKKLPTMDKEGKLMNIVRENETKRPQIAASISNRANFLHNTAINNMRSEANRLQGLFAEGAQSFANDGRFRRLSNEERMVLGQRAQRLSNDIRNMQPIIGAQGRYTFI